MKVDLKKAILFSLILSSFIAFSLNITTFFSEQINTSVICNITKAGTTSLYNFSIIADSNFTALNLTIPLEFIFIENSPNTTLYPNWTCSNFTEKKINCTCPLCNISVNGTNSIYVWLNATSPDYENETWFNFSVFVWDYKNNSNSATEINTSIGNDGNITFIGNVSGVINDTIIYNQNITIKTIVRDDFAEINTSKNNSVKILLLNYTDGNIKKIFNATYTGNNNFSAIFDTGHLADGAYNISVLATDKVENYRYLNTTKYFNVTPQPDLIIKTVNWNSSFGDSFPFSSYEGNYTNITINVTLKNNGTGAVVNFTKVTVKWDSVILTPFWNFSDLNAGSELSKNYTIIGNSSNVKNNMHSIFVELDEQNNQTEKNENNNNVTENLYIGYNVSVFGISPLSVVPGDNINISVKVLYGNGSAVDNLTQSDFKIYDSWNSGSYTTANGNIQSIDLTQNTSGIYNITYKVNSSIYGSEKKIAQFGMHHMRVNAIKGNYSGWKNDTGNNYTITAPNLEVWFENVDTTLRKNTQKDLFYIKMKNSGNIEIKNITIKIQTNNSDSLKMSTQVDGTYSHTYTCNKFLSIGDSLDANSKETASCSLYLKGTSNGKYKLSVIYAYGETITNIKYNSTNLPYNTITVSTTDTTTDDDTTTTTTNTNNNPTNIEKECTVDSNCSSTYFCNYSNKCQKIKCKANQLISNHKCTDIKINIICNKSFFIEQGQNITVPFYLNSTKYKISSIYLEATKPSEFRGNVSIAPSSQTVIKNIAKRYNITFSMPKDAVFKKEYVFEIKVKKGTKNTFAVRNITLIVSGGNDTKRQISDNIDIYEKTLKNQLNTLEDIKSKLDKEEGNLIQARTDKIQKIIDDIRALIENKEYLKADKKINELNTEMKNLNNSITTLVEKKAKETKRYKVYLFIILILAGIGGLVYYMMLPDERGYHPTKGYIKKSQKQEFKEQIIEIIDNVIKNIQIWLKKKKEENPLKKRVYNYANQSKKK